MMRSSTSHAQCWAVAQHISAPDIFTMLCIVAVNRLKTDSSWSLVWVCIYSRKKLNGTETIVSHVQTTCNVLYLPIMKVSHRQRRQTVPQRMKLLHFPPQTGPRRRWCCPPEPSRSWCTQRCLAPGPHRCLTPHMSCTPANSWWSAHPGDQLLAGSQSCWRFKHVIFLLNLMIWVSLNMFLLLWARLHMFPWSLNGSKLPSQTGSAFKIM